MTSIADSIAPSISHAMYPEKTDWRIESARQLYSAGYEKEAINFLHCEQEYRVAICSRDIEHPASAIPLTCHLRYCPQCERREQARKLSRYVPAIWDCVNEAHPAWHLKKLEITTPFYLLDSDAPEKFEIAWVWVKEFINRLFFQVMKQRNKLSAAELRRGRIDLKKHGIGVLAAAEFGERGHKLHFHLLLLCPFLKRQLVTDTWREVTGGECYINWLKEIENENLEDGINEVVKYCTKFQELSPAMVVNLANVLAGQRRFRSFGLFYNLPKREQSGSCCEICNSSWQIIDGRTYIERCMMHNILLDEEIIKKLEASASRESLYLKLGNKFGESTYVERRATETYRMEAETAVHELSRFGRGEESKNPDTGKIQGDEPLITRRRSKQGSHRRRTKRH